MKTSLEDINLFRASQVCRGFVEVQSPVGSKNFREKKCCVTWQNNFEGDQSHAMSRSFKKI